MFKKKVAPNLQVFAMLETTSFGHRTLPSLLGRGRHLLFSTTCAASFGFFVLVAHRETPFQLKKQKRENQAKYFFFKKKSVLPQSVI